MHAAGCDHVESADFGQLACGWNVETIAQTVSADISKDHRAQAEGLHLDRKVVCCNTAAFLPAANTGQSIARIDPDCDLFRTKLFQRSFDNVRLFDRDRSEDHTIHTQGDRVSDRFQRAYAAA